MKDYGRIQYKEAVEALKKLEPWRLAEIRHEMKIDPPKAKPEQGGD